MRLARAPRSAVLWAVAAAAGAAAAASFVLLLHVDNERAPVVHAALVGWIIVAYVVCGLIAWRQRPESRFGLLMIAGGFAPFLSTLSAATAEVPHTIGELLRRLPIAVFTHLFLAYPTGRLQGRFERLLVCSSYLLAVALGFVPVLLGSGGPHSLLQVVDRPSAADIVYQAQAAGLLVLMLGVVGVLGVRWRRSGRTLRRLRGLVLGSFLLAVAALALGAFFAAQGGTAAPVRWFTFGFIAVAPLAFLSRLLDARLARSTVGDLFVELRTEPAPVDVQDALARTLRDPSLTLAYWLPEFGSYADLDGRRVELPETASEGAVTTLIDRDGVHIAAMVHDPSLREEPELLEAVTAAAGIALENAQLHAELRARLEELQGSRARVIEAGQRERQRLERDLHDGAQQRLVALSLELKALEKDLGERPRARTRLDNAQREITLSLEELRDLARGIHPAVLSAHGLAVALEQVVARAPLRVQLTVRIDGRLPEAVEVAAYFVVTESLANVVKHARAQDASVEIGQSGHMVFVEVLDDGVGGADSERGSGLRGLADRVEALGGRIRVWTPHGGGTRVRADIPCA
jgi:signal transduction histidine kinase